MTDTKNIDKLLSQAFHQYVDEQLTEEFSNVLVFETSASFDKKISRAIKSEHNYYYKFTLTRARKILCACIIILIIMLSLLSVGAVRDAIAGFFVEHFSDHDTISVISETEAKRPTKIEKVYVPTYIPKGFELMDEDISDAGVTLIFVNGNDTIIYNQYLADRIGVGIDNEHSTKTVEEIDDQKYFINTSKIEDDIHTSIYWDNGEYLFELSAELPKNIVLNMCKSLKIKEN